MCPPEVSTSLPHGRSIRSLAFTTLHAHCIRSYSFIPFTPYSTLIPFALTVIHSRSRHSTTTHLLNTHTRSLHSLNTFVALTTSLSPLRRLQFTSFTRVHSLHDLTDVRSFVHFIHSILYITQYAPSSLLCVRHSSRAPHGLTVTQRAPVAHAPSIIILKQ
jgi:hypothetical protein